MRSKFAKVTWSVEDILGVRPHWTKKRCAEVLSEIEDGLESDMISRGWDTIYFLIGSDYDEDGNNIDPLNRR